jgi:hypothetical protein
VFFLEALNHGQLAMKSFGTITFVEKPIADDGYWKSQFDYIVPADRVICYCDPLA